MSSFKQSFSNKKKNQPSHINPKPVEIDKLQEFISTLIFDFGALEAILSGNQKFP